MSRPPLVDALIDAQTAYVIEELGTISRESVAEVVASLLQIAESVTLSAFIPADLAIDVVTQVRSNMPASVGAGEVVEAVLDVAFAGPTQPVTASELVARDQLEAVLDEILGHTGVLEALLEDITSGPLVGAMASRFIGRIVGEVVATNQAVADKVPGLGALVSFGTSAAAKVASVADKQLEAVLGDTAGKSAAFAVRRLNTIALDIARDPATREAILEIWDQVSERPITGLEGQVDREEASRLADAVRAMIATAADTDAAADLAQRVVASVYARYGDLPIIELVNDFDIDREALVDHLHTTASSACEAALKTDEVEALIRRRVETFFTRAEIAMLLAN
ncbi:MAG TPA: hypothetical protein VN108_02080 [Marmoricola sp.]|nr:hypothetical protein [Marmoricola sp.]